jgi:hypothetical protein
LNPGLSPPQRRWKTIIKARQPHSLVAYRQLFRG